MTVQDDKSERAATANARATGSDERTSDEHMTLGADHSTVKRQKARRKPKRGAIAQVVLFTSIWSALVSSFGLVAVLPTLIAVLQQRGVVTLDPNGSSSIQLGGDDINALLSASSTTTLAVSAATALATVLSVWIMRRYFDGPALLDLGLRRRPGWLTDSVVGLALGPAMFGTILLLLLAAGWASVGAGDITAQSMLTAFLTFVLVAFSEEVFARGWVLQVLEKGRGKRAAVIGSAGIFATLHALNPGFGLMALVGLFLAGLLFAQAYMVTRQLWLPMALHLSWNFSEGPLLGFPVSGLPGEGLLLTRPTGPELITGGSFGPEAGLVVILGIGLAAAAIWYLGRHRAARARGATSEVSVAG